MWVRLARGQLELSPNYQELSLWPALSYQDIEQLKLVCSFPSSLPQTHPSEGVLVKTPSTHVQTRFFRLLDQTALKLEQEAYICQINPLRSFCSYYRPSAPEWVGKPSWMGGIGQGCRFGLGSLAQADMQALSGSQASTSDTFFQSSLTFQWLLWVSGLLAYTGTDRSLESLLSSLSTRQVSRRPLGNSHPSAWMPILLCLPQPPLDGGTRRAECCFLKEDPLVPDRARPLNSDRQETRHSRFNVLWFPPVKTGKLSACLEYLH